MTYFVRKLEVIFFVTPGYLSRTNRLIWFAFLFRRVRDKYESELKELEESERKMQEKYNSMKVIAKCLY